MPKIIDKKYIKKLNEITPLKFTTEKFVYSKANGDKKYHKLN